MNYIYLYPITKNIFKEIVLLYELQDAQLLENNILRLENTQLESLVNLRENILLDFQIQIKSFSCSRNWNLNINCIKHFIEASNPQDYLISDYLFYCLVFDKDQLFQNTVQQKLIDLPNELIATLTTYIRLNGNTMRSAKQLFLHRNSLIFRLDKIEKRLSLDLSDARVIHSLAILILKLNL